MAYSMTTWENNTTPALNATNLNKIEQGIYDATNTAESKSVVSVSATGTATDEIQYITINGTEKKIAGGGSGGDGDLFLITYDATLATPAADKTYTEIKTAYDAGKSILLKYKFTDSNSTAYVYMTDYIQSGTGFVFMGKYQKESWYYTAYAALLTSSNTWIISPANSLLLPDTSRASDMDVVMWDATGESAAWASITDSLLPSYSSATAGQVLTIDSEGSPAWEDGSSVEAYTATEVQTIWDGVTA